jgi:hypothetical protein
MKHKQMSLLSMRLRLWALCQDSRDMLASVIAEILLRFMYVLPISFVITARH